MSRLSSATRLFALLLLGASLAAQTDTFVPANDLSMILSTERRSYATGSKIKLKYRIVNVSNAPLFAPRDWEATCPANPHFWAWVENSSGQHFQGGWGGSCFPQPQSIAQRMAKEAVLLKPGEHLDGTFQLDTALFGGLKPGRYRIEAVLWCWNPDKFSDAERVELAKMGRFMYGEVRASMTTTITP